MSQPTTASPTGEAVTVHILHVADCPNVEQVRTRVERSLTRLGLIATITEVEGAYRSPTLLINGMDVIPRPASSEASCRLDLPTEAQIGAALERSTVDPRSRNR